jgi:nicotinamidase-related amidase
MINLNTPTAVLIIDVQNFMFSGDDKVFAGEEILQRIKDIEDFAKAKKLLTIYIQHSGPAGNPEEYGTETWKLHPALSVNGEVIGKTKLEAFESTKLDAVLKENKIEQVIICGMQSNFCITANTKASVAFGYKTIVVSDAHSTCDYDNKTGEELISAVNSDLKGIATLVTTSELVEK